MGERATSTGEFSAWKRTNCSWEKENLPCNALPQEVSTSEDGAFVRVSGYVNTTVSSETVSYKVAHYLCDAL